jgi:gamma-glutamyl-gamma-aminobutyrate hydrolase PuuD
MTPVVGLVAGEANASWGQWHQPAVLLPASYVDRLSEAGALPVLLPPVGPAAAAVVPHLDALVLAGGGDLAPSTYGGAGHPGIYGVNPDRDQTELAVTAAADERGLPILAICRGIQVLNVARGGTLHPHLPDVVGHEGHSGGKGEYGRHRIVVTAGSRLAGVMGPAGVAMGPAGVAKGPAGAAKGPAGAAMGPAGAAKDPAGAAKGPAGAARWDVATHHHQAVDRVGRGLVVVARAEDGTVEAVEDARRFVVGVQWHPEADDDGRLFQALVAAAGGLR